MSSRHGRNDAEERQSEVRLDLVGGLHAAVHVLETENEANREDTAAKKRHRQIAARLRHNRSARHVSPIDDEDAAVFVHRRSANHFRHLEQVLVQLDVASGVVLESRVGEGAALIDPRLGVDRSNDGLFSGSGHQIIGFRCVDGRLRGV
jgi:hypothetical protein